jgi:hypothetical protein
MSAYDYLVLAIAGANGGLFYWAFARRKEILARIKVRAKR